MNGPRDRTVEGEFGRPSLDPMPARLGILLLAVLALAPGCATAALIAKVSGAERDASSSRLDTWTPTGPRETTLRLDLAYEPPPPPPPPAPVVEAPLPPPGPPPRVIVGPVSTPPGPPVILVPAPPYPPPPPPPPIVVAPAPPPRPEGSVRVLCQQNSRYTTVHNRSERWLYEPIHKILIGFFGLSETAMASASFYSYSKNPEAAALAAGILIGLDALGTWALMAHPKKNWVVEWDGPGPVVSLPACPEGLTVEAAGLRAPVAPDGTVAPEVGARVLEAMLQRGGSFSFAVGEAGLVAHPTQAQRCRFAEQNRLPRPPGCPVWWDLGLHDWSLPITRP